MVRVEPAGQGCRAGSVSDGWQNNPGLRGGTVIGETDPGGGKKSDKDQDAVAIADVYATVLTVLGINPAKHNQANISQSGVARPMALTDGGKALKQLILS